MAAVRPCFVLAVIGLATSCSASPPEPLTASQPTPGEGLPGVSTGLRSADSILGLGLALGGAGDIHLAWSAAIAGAAGTAPSYRTDYVRSEKDARDWSSPLAMDDTLGAPRLLAAGERVTLVTGLRLLAFTSRDGGRSWDPPISLLPKGARKVAAFDAALDGDDLVVACVIQPSTPYERRERTADHEQRVVIVRLTPAGVPREIEIGRFAPSLLPPARPRIVASDGRLRLAVGLNMDGTDANVVEERPVLLWFESDGANRTWSPARTLDLASGRDEIDRIEALDLVDAEGTTHLLLAGHAIHVVSSTRGAGWSPPRHLNPYDTRLSRGELRAPAVAAAAIRGEGRIVWIDHRNRASDRRPWNPLGGLPWSDDNPLGANNDVFSLPVSALGEAQPPVRLTAASSFARAVEIAAAGDEFLVAWGGRSGVGKEPTSGDAPSIYLTTIPAHRAGSSVTP